MALLARAVKALRVVREARVTQIGVAVVETAAEMAEGVLGELMIAGEAAGGDGLIVAVGVWCFKLNWITVGYYSPCLLLVRGREGEREGHGITCMLKERTLNWGEGATRD